MEHDGYQELANAIVIRAAKDYRILLRFYQKHPDNAIAESRIDPGISTQMPHATFDIIHVLFRFVKTFSAYISNILYFLSVSLQISLLFSVSLNSFHFLS